MGKNIENTYMTKDLYLELSKGYYKKPNNPITGWAKDMNRHLNRIYR